MRTRSLITTAAVVTGLITVTPATASAEPGMEYAGDIYIKGHEYGIAYFDDYAGSKDRDLFYVYDIPGDGASVTLRVCYSHTCKTKRASYGSMEKIDVGNIGNGYKAWLTACGWKDGIKIGCADSSITE